MYKNKDPISVFRVNVTSARTNEVANLILNEMSVIRQTEQPLTYVGGYNHHLLYLASKGSKKQEKRPEYTTTVSPRARERQLVLGFLCSHFFLHFVGNFNSYLHLCRHL